MSDKGEPKKVDNCPLDYDYCYHYCYFYKDEQCLYEEFKKDKGDEGNTGQDITSPPLANQSG